jgi:DNA replication licensing factor MCM4
LLAHDSFPHILSSSFFRSQDRQQLASYISYARENINPELSEDAAKALVDAYVTMRRTGNSRRTITATPRQLEALIRLSEAHAKMHYSSVVTAANVNAALELMQNALRQAATDPRTGLIDLDLIATGQSTASRHQVLDLAKAVMDFLQKKRLKSVLFNTLLADIGKTSDIVSECVGVFVFSPCL